MKKVNIILLVLWLITIFMFSNDNGSQSNDKSDTVANTFISFISNITGIDIDTLNEKSDIVIFIIRKTAHFLEYFILGLLVIRVLCDYIVFDLKLCMIGILLCFIYSCSDEIHQLFISERTGKPLDVIIDTLGSSASIFLYYYFKVKKKEKV